LSARFRMVRFLDKSLHEVVGRESDHVRIHREASSGVRILLQVGQPMAA